MAITPEQIRYFITACRYQNFTKAAEELHLTQPGLSKAIRELEAQCGAPLWERRHNALTLTAAGKVFLEQAQKFQEQYEQLEYTARSLGSGEALLRIGLVPMCGNTIFPGLHRALQEAWPQLRIITTEATGPILYSLLDQQEIDLALCVTNHLPEAPYHCRVLKDSRLMLFVHKDHPLATRSSVDLKNLEEEEGTDYVFTTIGDILRFEEDDNQIIQYIVDHTPKEPDTIVFLTGVGKCYPVLRSHKILNNLHQVMDHCPVILLFPGQYTGSALNIFGEIKGDSNSNYYRAFPIVER